jgi:arylsulfatase A-like enzyme
VRLQNTYAAAVTFFDAQLGKLLEHLPDRNATLICVTARSGLPLGEHDMIGAPLPLLHDELVHLPLVMRLPNTASARLRVAALTQPVDLVPTFLEFLGLPTPPVHGSSLWPLIRGDVDAVRPYAVAMMRVGDQESWLMRTQDRALHVPMTPRHGMDLPRLLFVKPDDRWEVNNLYQHEVELADAMEKELAGFAEVIQRPGPLLLKSDALA